MARPDLPVPEGAEELVRALRSPATPAELACEPRAVAAFRNAYREGGPATARKRRRLTLTAALATGAVASLSITGVAAAYTGALPRPLQRAMHAVLGPVGIPAPVAAARRTVPVGPVTPAVALPEAAPEPATVTPPASAASPVAAALTPDQRARALCRLVARRPSDPALRGRLARLTHAGEDVAALCRRVDPAPARTPHAPPSPSPSRSPSPSPTRSSPAPLPTPSAPGPTATAGAGPAPTARPTRSP